jgi:hypothetical protein
LLEEVHIDQGKLRGQEWEGVVDSLWNQVGHDVGLYLSHFSQRLGTFSLRVVSFLFFCQAKLQKRSEDLENSSSSLALVLKLLFIQALKKDIEQFPIRRLHRPVLDSEEFIDLVDFWLDFYNLSSFSSWN